MTHHRDSLEAFNRASHSDALREMQMTSLTESPRCEASYRYRDQIRPTPASAIRSMGARDLLVSIATAALLVIVIPLGLLVVSVL